MRFTHIKIILCLAMLLGLLACGQTPSGADQHRQLQASIDSLAQQAMASGHIAGAVVLVAHNGNVLAQGAYGYQDPPSQEQMSMDSIFRLSSVSKAFTTMAAAALLERQVLDLRDPVSKWLPGFTPALPDGRRPTITIAQLMSHKAGLDYGFTQEADGPYAMAGVSTGLDDIPTSLEENMERLAGAPLIYEPGSSWKYSMAADVLGAVVAKAYGASLPQAIKELVLDPLGLKDTGFYVNDASRLVTPCYIAAQGLRPMEREQVIAIDNAGHYLHFSQLRAFDENAWPSGGAGMLASGPDVLALLEGIRQNRLVSQATLQEINTNQIPGMYPLGPGVGFALGWAIIIDPAAIGSPQSAGSISWGGVYGHNWFIDHKRAISVVVLTSTAMEMDFSLKVRDAVYCHLDGYLSE